MGAKPHMNTITTELRIVSAGLLSTIQDTGRFGLRHLGIPWAGALCPAWQAIANALVGNDSTHPIIECFEGGLQIQAIDHEITVAVVGSPSAVIKVGSKAHGETCKPNRSLTIAPGDSLALSSTGDSRHAVLAIANVDIPEHLGSASTYAKASLGGLNGSVLQAGDTVCIQHHSLDSGNKWIHKQCQLPEELLYQRDELRVIAGPQFDHFSGDGIDTFLSACFELSAEADRMGVRLDGPVITHLNASSKDIVSDAIVPGSIQIPGTGLPIVLLNDAHTAGGYPKIATVISIDLPVLGVRRAGSQIRFKRIDIDQAIAARTHQQQLLERAIESISPCIVLDISLDSLFSNNLIDGVTDGH